MQSRFDTAASLGAEGVNEMLTHEQAESLLGELYVSEINDWYSFCMTEMCRLVHCIS